jgi:hypothetical protein
MQQGIDRLGVKTQRKFLLSILFILFLWYIFYNNDTFMRTYRELYKKESRYQDQASSVDSPFSNIMGALITKNLLEVYEKLGYVCIASCLISLANLIFI